MDVLSGWSKELDQVMRKLKESKCGIGKDAESSHYKYFEYGMNI